jgi:cytochrome c-type biogenesis protein CcmF
MFPVVSEAVRGTAVTVGPPYYNFFFRIFGLPLLLLMGIGPLVAWRRASLRSLGRSLAWPAGAALVAGVLLLAAGAGSSLPGLIAYTFAAFVLATIVLEFARGTRARKALGASSWPGAFAGLVARNRRRYGGYISHAAVVLLAIGVVGSSLYRSSESRRVETGQSVSVGNYTLKYLRPSFTPGANHDEIRAVFSVTRGGENLGVVAAGKNRYHVEAFFANAVAIRTDWLRGEDLFVIGDQFNRDGSVELKVFVNPLVGLIWIAGAVFLLGSVVALWPDAREQRRLAHRTLELEAARA